MKGLDRYLTSEPSSDFDGYSELLCEAISDEFYEKHEVWLLDETPLFDKWADMLYLKDVEPDEAAAIIERAYNLYVKE